MTHARISNASHTPGPDPHDDSPDRALGREVNNHPNRGADRDDEEE